MIAGRPPASQARATSAQRSTAHTGHAAGPSQNGSALTSPLPSWSALDRRTSTCSPSPGW